MGLPLASIRVVDLTRFRSGPTAVRQLSDMGAQVIQVVAPARAAAGRRRSGCTASTIRTCSATSARCG